MVVILPGEPKPGMRYRTCRLVNQNPEKSMVFDDVGIEYAPNLSCASFPWQATATEIFGSSKRAAPRRLLRSAKPKP
jgi:hypothetical protein